MQDVAGLRFVGLRPWTAQRTVATVPPVVKNLVPTLILTSASIALLAAAPPAKPGCADKPEVRLFHWAWNAQSGLMYAAGGKQAVEGSLMCKNGVNLKLIREDNTDNMQSQLLAFAEGLKAGEKNPSKGAHFVIIMGDGAAVFLKGLNDRLLKLGPDFGAQIVGVAGYSRGEDKFMGPAEWKKNPAASKGGLVAGVLRDGDWNIALKWLGDNKLKNNPDETSYDPDALNWVAASDYIDAAQKYVSGFCTELKNIKTGEKEKKCVQGVVTWTPGDVTVAEQKGGLVSIVSTYEYRSQMPSVIIGNKKWMNENRALVKGLLSSIFAGGDAVRTSPENLKKAAAISAVVYGERDADYWARYFNLREEKDKLGNVVQLGGSAVATLSDNTQVFGLTGGKNLIAATYTIFAEIVRSQYPTFLESYYPPDQVIDSSFVKELAAGK